MRATRVGATLAAALVLAGCPGARARRASPPPPDGDERRTSTEYDFEDDTVEGDLIKPDGAALGTRTKTRAEAILAAQNAVRAEHCAEPLVWSVELELRAAARARALRDRACDLAAVPAPPGENLALAAPGALTPAATVARWAREEERVDFPAARVDPRTARFTQLVWKDSLAVGCAPVTCADRDGWVCLYDPPGNVDGDVALNVAPRGCQ